ncbi:MAG: 16S rRNA (cytosine(1402)-N(4))-methyltransferase RsmH [Clostridia bacterium]|nr:16S rRNA (cytosine(1402)-N(4))-methyltransferase RsmH [Clostridia bacterium]
MEFVHKSVLFEECMQMLDVKPGGIYIDGTLGGGGHSEGILERSAPDGELLGIDRDAAAHKAAGERLARFGDRVTFLRGNFADMKELVDEKYHGQIDGILLDLGVSSHQIDEPTRGFSYMVDALLDMRMDTRSDFSAYTVVNTYSMSELRNIISRYGEEKWASRIAQFIVDARAKAPIETTGQLEDIIKAAVPAGARKGVAHPARRTFQAIRIEVNGELDAVRQGVEAAVDMLKPGGRLAVITFHSLEDHLVKDLFRKMENPCTCPKGSPVCVCGKKPIAKQVSRKPIVSGEAELAENPRAHSAHLRGITKL